MIISDKSKLMQELYAKMTQVTDAYNVTHKVMYCGDVEEIIEKFFMDKHSDWLTADKPKDEPQNLRKITQDSRKDEPQTEREGK